MSWTNDAITNKQLISVSFIVLYIIQHSFKQRETI